MDEYIEHSDIRENFAPHRDMFGGLFAERFAGILCWMFILQFGIVRLTFWRENRMTVAEKIVQHVNGLPERFQVEVLNFVEFIETKSSPIDRESAEWGAASLAEAMRGLETEPSIYSTSDLKEVFA